LGLTELGLRIERLARRQHLLGPELAPARQIQARVLARLALLVDEVQSP
jgi:hypothetical protein